MAKKNVKHLWLSLNTSWASVFGIDAYVCTISNVTGINKEKETCLLNKEHLSSHR